MRHSCSFLTESTKEIKGWKEERATDFLSCEDFFFFPERRGAIFNCYQMAMKTMWSPGMKLLLFSHSVMFDSLRPCGLLRARLPYPSLSPRVCSNSCPPSWWCHSTSSSSVVPFSACLQCFPASGSFPMSWFVTSGGQSIRASASASVLPMNIQVWDGRISNGKELVIWSAGSWICEFQPRPPTPQPFKSFQNPVFK